MGSIKATLINGFCAYFVVNFVKFGKRLGFGWMYWYEKGSKFLIKN